MVHVTLLLKQPSLVSSHKTVPFLSSKYILLTNSAFHKYAQNLCLLFSFVWCLILLEVPFYSMGFFRGLFYGGTTSARFG